MLIDTVTLGSLAVDVQSSWMWAVTVGRSDGELDGELAWSSSVLTRLTFAGDMGGVRTVLVDAGVAFIYSVQHKLTYSRRLHRTRHLLNHLQRVLPLIRLGILPTIYRAARARQCHIPLKR